MEQKLLKGEFMSKVIYNRLLMYRNITDVSLEEIQQLMTEFENMVKEGNYSYDTMKCQPLTENQFKNIREQFTVRLQRNTHLIPIEATPDQIDEAYMHDIVDALLWATKMYVYCSHYAHDKSIMAIPSLKSIRGPFYNLGYTTLHDLALIFANTNNPDQLKGIGPDKYKKFKKFFAYSCNEFEVYKRGE